MFIHAYNHSFRFAQGTKFNEKEVTKAKKYSKIK